MGQNRWLRPWLGCLVTLVMISACASPRLATAPLSPGELDVWSAHIVTQDADGAERSARIWIVLHDDRGVIRTGGSRWRANIARGSSVALRIDSVDYPVMAIPIDRLNVRQEVDAEFLRKYGWQESMLIPSDRATSDDAYLRITPAP